MLVAKFDFRERGFSDFIINKIFRDLIPDHICKSGIRLYDADDVARQVHVVMDSKGCHETTKSLCKEILPWLTREEEKKKSQERDELLASMTLDERLVFLNEKNEKNKQKWKELSRQVDAVLAEARHALAEKI